MDYYSSQITKLIEELSRLPGIGNKSAARLAFHMINMPKEQVEQLANTMVEARNNVRYCKECCTLTDQELCPICASTERDHQTIMDGRDIGTVVLPNADVKIFLTASSKVRAKRRYDELTEKGVECDFDEIEKDIIDRDYRDMHRETAPLKQAEDAILLDSSELDIDGVVNRMKEIIKEAIG